MGHHISGIIARRQVLANLGVRFAGQPSYSLEEGLAFMPLDYVNLDEIRGPREGKDVENFVYLNERLIELLSFSSRIGAIAYVETDYFGGTGAQGAAVFRDGEMIGSPKWGKVGTINEALFKIGVARRADRVDAFEAVGLVAFRSNESFRDKGTSA